MDRHTLALGWALPTLRRWACVSSPRRVDETTLLVSAIWPTPTGARRASMVTNRPCPTQSPWVGRLGTYFVRISSAVLGCLERLRRYDPTVPGYDEIPYATGAQVELVAAFDADDVMWPDGAPPSDMWRTEMRPGARYQAEHQIKLVPIVEDPDRRGLGGFSKTKAWAIQTPYGRAVIPGGAAREVL